MEVVFRRTGTRRYSVTATPPGGPTLIMDPAPGYDEALPHDLIHYVVEEELDLALGVFGQLAEGGDAGSFHLPPAEAGSRERTRLQRRIKRRGERLGRMGQDDAEFSERAASICHQAWLARSPDPGRRRQSRAMEPYVTRTLATCSEAELASLSDESMERICTRLDELSARWSELGVGDAIVLTWGGAPGLVVRRPRVFCASACRRGPGIVIMGTRGPRVGRVRGLHPEESGAREGGRWPGVGGAFDRYTSGIRQRAAR